MNPEQTEQYDKEVVHENEVVMTRGDKVKVIRRNGAFFYILNWWGESILGFNDESGDRLSNGGISVKDSYWVKRKELKQWVHIAPPFRKEIIHLKSGKSFAELTEEYEVIPPETESFYTTLEIAKGVSSLKCSFREIAEHLGLKSEGKIKIKIEKCNDNNDNNPTINNEEKGNMQIRLKHTKLGIGTLDTDSLRFTPDHPLSNNDPVNGFCPSDLNGEGCLHASKDAPLTPNQQRWIDEYIISNLVNYLTFCTINDIKSLKEVSSQNWMMGATLKHMGQLKEIYHRFNSYSLPLILDKYKETIISEKETKHV